MFWLQMDSRLLPELLEERMMIVVSVADGGKKSWSVRLSYICQRIYIRLNITLYIYIASSLCCMLLEGIVAYVIYNFYLCIQYI